MDPRVVISAADLAVRANLARLLSGSRLLETSPAAVLELLERHSSLALLVVAECAGEDHAVVLDLIAAVNDRKPEVAVLLLSDHVRADDAAEAIRRGAEDVLALACGGELLRKQVARILEAADLRERVRALRQLVPRRHSEPSIIGRAAPMVQVLERVAAAARSDTPVLITGETGTGKELIARAIHGASRRASKPFVPINCAALPRDLLESELFGHRRGAFSGAYADYAGLFVAADGGTIFLDEISELPLEAQPKLLRVLQDGEVRPVGGLTSRRVDARVIAATNRTLEQIRLGALRQDLFFRLSVVVIGLPPLRDRLDDVPLLVSAFVAQLRDRGIAVDSMAADAVALLSEYEFPGNVRELENLIEGIATMLPVGRASIVADDVHAWLRLRSLPTQRASTSETSLPLRLDRLEAWAIVEAMRRTHGNKRQAAFLLGISRDTLYRKLQEIGWDADMSESRTAAAPR